MTNPLVSIIIDTYNQADFVRTAIDSALNQTFDSSKVEIIVIDDGSTDNTPRIIVPYKDKIKYIYKKNGGQGSVFNYAARMALGEYLVFLDADDYCLSDRVKKVVDEFESYNDLTIVFNARQLVDKQGAELLRESRKEYHNIGLARETVNEVCEIAYGTSRSAVKKHLFQKILPISEKLTIEADLYFLALLCHGRVSSLSDCLTAYRVHDNNLFHTQNIDRYPLKMSCISTALSEIKTYVTGHRKDLIPIYNKILAPYQIELKELEFTFDVAKKNARRSALFKIEKMKIRHYWGTWPFLYKIYKLIRLPFLLALPPSLSSQMVKLYSLSNFKAVREKLFPSKKSRIT